MQTQIEDNVDAIRDAIYEEIKDMTSEERTAYYNSIAEEARKKHNIHVIPSAKGVAAAVRH